MLERLRAVQAGLAPAAGEPAPAAWAVVTTSLAYLEKRQAQLRYAAFQAAGYPIGDGAVESANKLVVEARLKGAGMRWAPGHVDAMVALRNVACTDRWEEAWPQVTGELRQQASARTTARRQARQAAATIAAPVEDAGASPEPATPAVLPALPTWRDSGPEPPPPAAVVAPPTPARRPRADHPWRRGLTRRSVA